MALDYSEFAIEAKLDEIEALPQAELLEHFLSRRAACVSGMR
jgi:hypothetical protein